MLLINEQVNSHIESNLELEMIWSNQILSQEFMLC